MGSKVTVTVRLSAPLSERIGSRGEIQVEATTVRESLERVVEKYPDFGKLLWSDNKQINSAILVFLEDEKINSSDLERPVENAAQIDVIPAISGG